MIFLICACVNFELQKGSCKREPWKVAKGNMKLQKGTSSCERERKVAKGNSGLQKGTLISCERERTV